VDIGSAHRPYPPASR